MECLVTGGAGFIGSHLVDRLLELGHVVTVFDDFSAGLENNLRNAKKNGMNEHLQIIHGNILDPKLVTQAVKHKDAIFHLAAHIRAKPSAEGPTCTSSHA